MQNFLLGKRSSAESRHSAFFLLQEAHCSTAQALLLAHRWDDTLWELQRGVPALGGERTGRRKQRAVFRAILLA